MALWSLIAEHVKAPYQVGLPLVVGQRLRSDSLALLLLTERGRIFSYKLSLIHI